MAEVLPASFFNANAYITYLVQGIVAHILFYFEVIGSFGREFEIGDNRYLVTV